MSPSPARAPGDPRPRGALSIGVLALVAALALIAIAVVAAFLLARPHRARTPSPSEPTAVVALRSPRGEQKSAPDSFVWDAVPGATDYKVTITDADAVWPLFVRTTASTSLRLDPGQTTAIVTGRIHSWEVEAHDARGAPIARGDARFRVTPPG